MSKVFPLFLVFVLVASVLLFAIPTQEQPANAYVNNDTNIMQYQLDGYTAFTNIPIGYVGYKFQFDVNDYLPFKLCYILLGANEGLSIALGYFNGVLSLWSPSDELNFYIEYNTFKPFRLEILLSARYRTTFRVYILINSEFVGHYSYVCDDLFNKWSVYFSNGNHIFEPYPYSYWENPSVSDLSVFYTAIPTYHSNTIELYMRSWVDGGAGYDAGYIDGMNDANDAKANLFPSIIGSIFAFFMSIASYEVLGISLLNIMIIVGSVLLLLAVLRVFLK